MDKKKATRVISTFLACIILSVILFTLSISAGYNKVSFLQVINGLFSGDETVKVLLSVNMPRTIVSFVSGIALAVSGVLFQSVTRNRLADPAIIGVSSASFVGSILAILLFPWIGVLSPIFAVIIGSLIFTLIFWLSYNQGLNSNRILAVGSAINMLCIVIVLTIAIMKNLAATSVILSFVGSLGIPKGEVVNTAIVMCAIGLISAIILAEKCNILALGDKVASGLGINVLHTKAVLAFVAVFLASTAAINIGITAFLGLLAPLIARKILGDNHFLLIPLAAITGGIILLAADCLGRYINTPVILPVGIVSTIAGGIIYLLLLKRAYNHAD